MNLTVCLKKYFAMLRQAKILKCSLYFFLFCCTDYKNPQAAVPVIFELGKVSTQDVEYGFSLSDSGKEAYFTRSADPWGTPNANSAIYFTIFQKGQWAKPQIVSFSGQAKDSDPHLSADGKTLYFISNRQSKDSPVPSADIWKVERSATGVWDAPVRLDDAINSEFDEYSPRTDSLGNLYFASNRPGGYGQGDLYVAFKSPSGWDPPVNLGPKINTAQGEWNLEISKDGNTLFFEASGRPQNASSYGDLYLSFKQHGQWTPPQNLTTLNTSGSDLSPEWREKTYTLYYASSDSLSGSATHIYVVDFKKAYQQYRKNTINSIVRPQE